MVEDGAFSPKIDYVTILNLEGHQNCITGSRVTSILLNGWVFFLLVKLHWEGSSPAACAAGLFFLNP